MTMVLPENFELLSVWGGESFSPSEIASEIQKLCPNFKVEYNVDFRQEIADKWPKSINDEQARKDWDWKPKYDLKSMTVLMLEKLKEIYNTSTLK